MMESEYAPSGEWMKTKLLAALAAVLTILTILAVLSMGETKSIAAVPPLTISQPAILAIALRSETAHYEIFSTATPEQTEAMAHAVEQLYVAYVTAFPVKPLTRKLTLVLYHDQGEFKRNNKSSPWAEAYYLKPRSHA
jgi:hypothetical protein